MLGISSSPIRNGNVDRMVKFILENSGKPFKFINLKITKDLFKRWEDSPEAVRQAKAIAKKLLDL